MGLVEEVEDPLLYTCCCWRGDGLVFLAQFGSGKEVEEQAMGAAADGG